MYPVLPLCPCSVVFYYLFIYIYRLGHLGLKIRLTLSQLTSLFSRHSLSSQVTLLKSGKDADGNDVSDVVVQDNPVDNVVDVVD